MTGRGHWNTTVPKPDMSMPNSNAPVIPPPILPGSTHIVRLQEAVTMEELSNDEEYNDIMEDMREECAKVKLLLLPCFCTVYICCETARGCDYGRAIL